MMRSKSITETHQIAAEVCRKINSGGLIRLYGELGSGKTEFTKGLLAGFGIDQQKIKSPTYTYIREYEANGQKIYHIDLYRIEEPDRLLIHEIEELAKNPRNIVVVEWADRLDFETSLPAIDITMQFVDESTRDITVN